MAFDPNNPYAFFSDLNNLSPDYTNDPTAGSAKIADLQAALQWAQANPNDPNSSYYISQLTPALQEQQNISGYDSNQQWQTDSANQLKTATDFMSKYSNDQNGMIAWAKDNGLIDQISLDMMGKDANIQAQILNKLGITAKWQSAYGGMQAQASQAQQNLNNPGNPTYKSAMDQGVTFAQPNYGQAEKNLGNYWAGVQTNTVQPLQQDIYQTAYNVKNDIAEKMNLMGQMGSGAAEKAKGMEDKASLTKDTTLTNEVNQAKAGSEAALKSNEQDSQNAYKDKINSIQGNELGASLAGAGNDLTKAFNTNTQSQLQNMQNTFDTSFLNKQAGDNVINGIGSSIGGLGGTLVGSVI